MSRAPLLVSLAAILVLTLTPALMFRGETVDGSQGTLIVLTPHNEQIRYEFSRGFSNWHAKKYGHPVGIAWSTPGGTTEIRRMLVAQYEADLRHGTAIGGDSDILFGGGSYEFHALTRPITAMRAGKEVSTTILEPCEWLTPEKLAELYGENSLDGQPIYDSQCRWFGAALSTFGIVSNASLCDHLGVAPPETWEELADPRLLGSVALVNPAQSGSIATAFETILQRLGWVRGWQVLRRAAANSNQILAASSRIPTAVGNGESAAGVAIDFYGRYQAQALADEAQEAGDPSIARLQFLAPRSESVIDADPVAVLRGAPNRELAHHFVEYCLSMEGQMLWQLPHGEGDACGYPRPELYSLRRLPARRAAYACCEPCFVDKVNPTIDQVPMVANPNFRDFVSPIFVSMAINQGDLLANAWKRILAHPAYPQGGDIVTAELVTDPQLKQWLSAFDAMPTVAAPDNGSLDLADPAQLGAIRAGWLKGGFKDRNLWSARDEPGRVLRRNFTDFFEERYSSIVDSPG